MKLNVVAANQSTKVDVVVAFSASKTIKEKSQTLLFSSKAPADLKNLLAQVPAERFKGAAEEIIYFRQTGTPSVLFVGMGEDPKPTSEQLRRLSATILRVLKAEKAKTARIYVPNGLSPNDSVVGLT